MAIPIRDAYQHLKYLPGAASAEAADAITKATSPSLPYGADFCELTWTDGNVTQLKYRVGGAEGTIVAILSFTYVDGNVATIAFSATEETINTES